MTTILQTKDLTKNYKGKNVVNQVNIHVQDSEVYGFIGQNGAGKTTTIRLILNLLQASSGHVELFGEKVTNQNMYKHLRRIGSIIEIPGFYSNLSAQENLEIHRIMMDVKDKSEIKRVLDIVNLNEEKTKKVAHYSLGMKQRLGIARAMLHNPDLLILDEPTNGLDPVGIVEIRDLIIDIAKKHGKTILVSSHILAEVEKMVNKVGILHHGRLLEEIQKEDFQQKSQRYLVYKVSDTQQSVKLLQQHFNLQQININEDTLTIQLTDERLNGSITKLLVENQITVMESRMVTPSLEELFIKLTEDRGNRHEQARIS
ncbi:ABC transporter ATP-binding protein [Paenibacillus sp. S150]|uniref:ABC transporter ATP-binding protein n=1 Tax=Paenibacillus sp. S150 TaxID=2749826 RepID=UPI001C588F38|nr:ABC transporter ATP-binding protein [Paenibacillus sp. S150]MBW4084445.1 ABC transporter ATP-binding protein [Paenibacillus sp. S150]